MNYLSWVALLIFLSVAAGLIRVLKGPTATDRMLAAQLFGTGGVATLLLLVHVMKIPELVDVALIYALLAAITMVVFVTWKSKDREETEKKKDEYP